MAERSRDEYLLTSESVTEGHPDKMADQISDAVLDAVLQDDPDARVACETFLTTGMVLVAGEITTTAVVDFQTLVRSVIRDIGYTRAKYGFDADTCAVTVALDRQSPDIAVGVDTGYENRVESNHDLYNQIGAGDQGMMFGYACDETAERMPLPIMLSHQLTHRLAQVRKNGTIPWLRPDGKAQVTVRYRKDRPVEVTTVVLSTQHDPEHNGVAVTVDDVIAPAIIEHVIKPVLGNWYNTNTRVLVNPTGVFVSGGPMADTGLTGRKIIVDTYGGAARHGGGAFSGKDPTKVDRSASYAARWIARNVVAAELARRCEVQVAYAIGVAAPVSLLVETFGTESVSVESIDRAVREVFDMRPAAIIDALELRQPIYRDTAAYGHFGRTDIDLPWERENRVTELRAAVERDTANGSLESDATVVGA